MTVFRDLSQHILDIYENGVKAGATLITVDIEEDLQQDLLTITLCDNGAGMDAEMLQHIADPWVTTRTTRKVGLGIPFFKQTAEMCGGNFAIHSQPGQGTTTQASFQYSHIDRPPLGDVATTVTCMIVGYPQVDLYYHHHLIGLTSPAEEEFILDTREVRAVLGNEVPLSDPEVLGFLRNTLEAGLSGITPH
ncbi:MAG: ATP-binding protein [Chloroflexota bacterium]|nr:ATP-binding protein [Chloroflexota bacterium]